MSLRYICGISSNVQITLLLSFTNLIDTNASPIKATGETSTQSQIAVKRGPLTLEDIEIQPAEECQDQMVNESKIFVSGNTRIPSANKTRTLTVEGTETQVTAEAQTPSAEKTKTRTEEATETGTRAAGARETQATGVSQIPSAGKTETQATTESTNLTRGETYTHTKTAEYKCTLPTEDFDIEFPKTYETKTTKESKPSIFNVRDISFHYIKKIYHYYRPCYQRQKNRFPSFFSVRSITRTRTQKVVAFFAAILGHLSDNGFKR